jgi:octaprenyl-diphosphate synthase
VIIAYANGTPDEQAFWNRTLGERDQKEGDLAHATALLNRHAAIEKTITLAHDYCEQARAMLTSIPASAEKSAMLDIVDFCASRGY